MNGLYREVDNEEEYLYGDTDTTNNTTSFEDVSSQPIHQQRLDMKSHKCLAKKKRYLVLANFTKRFCY